MITEIFNDIRTVEELANDLMQTQNFEQNFVGNERALDQAETIQQIQHERRLDSHLTAFRGRHPFIDVLPFPRMIRTLEAVTSNQSFDIQIPDSAELMRIDAPLGIYFYVGQSKIAPLTTLSGADLHQDFLVSPTGLFWCKHIRHLYALIPTLGDLVSISFYGDL
jgi:hypothetical protein